MGRIVSIIQFTGRAGSAVGSKGKGGKVLLRQYQPTVANPRTAAQMAQRTKIKLASQVAGMLGDVGRTALVANGNRKTDRGKLVKQLLKSIRVSQDVTQASLAYDLNLIDNPSYDRALSMAVASSENAYVATFTGAEEGEVVAKCILVHDVTNGAAEEETLAAPVISGNTTFSESTQVTITGPDGAEIRYTTDGSTPTAESTLYSEPFTLTNNTRVKAIAIKNGVTSPEATKYFTHNTVSDGE